MTPGAPLPAIPSKVDQVYDFIRAQILDGRFAPGSRLSMDALARTLGVSRIPIREAMNRLESQGLVVQRQHVGPTVASMSFHQLQGVYLARGAVEALCGELAATSISTEQIDDLEGVHLEMSSQILSGDITNLSDLNSRFHLLIAEATGYQVLRQLTDQLILAVRRYRAVTPLDRNNWRRAVSEHATIIEALRAHDPQAARKAVAAHMHSQASREPEPDRAADGAPITGD